MVKGLKVIDKISSDKFTNFKHKTFQYFSREKLILILLNYLKCFHKGQDSCLEFAISPCSPCSNQSEQRCFSFPMWNSGCISCCLFLVTFSSLCMHVDNDWCWTYHRSSYFIQWAAAWALAKSLQVRPARLNGVVSEKEPRHLSCSLHQQQNPFIKKRERA